MAPSKLSDILGTIAIQKSLLLVTGCWPLRKPSFTYRCKNYLSWASEITFQFFLFSELYANFKRGEFKEMTELLSSMASYVPYVFKHFIFAVERTKFLDALEKLKRPMFNQYPKELDKYVQSTTRFVRIFMSCYLFTVVNLVLLYSLKPFFSHQMAIRFSLIDFGPYWFIFHCYQIACIGSACYNNATLDVLALGIISIGSTQFEILRDKIMMATKWAGLRNEEIDDGIVNEDHEMDEAFDKKVNSYVGECVKHHLGILEFAADLEDIYSYYFLMQLADSVLAICNTWFQFMFEDEIIKLMFLGFYCCTLMLQLGIYCIYGNNLMLKSEELRDACYFSNWYNSDTKVRKSLMLIMERSKRPTTLTAGKFSVLNLATFVSIIKTSYSYFTLMNQLYSS